jgi:hypothetical protein
MNEAEETIRILKEKLTTAVGSVDQATFNAIREQWEHVSPAPTCPSILETMQNIKRICAFGINDRIAKSSETVKQFLANLPAGISPGIAADAKQTISSLFPLDLYVGASQNTLGVYQRANAPSNKYSQRHFELELALIKTGSANLSRRGIAAIQTDIDECYIQNRAPTPPSNLSEHIRRFWMQNWKWAITTIVAIIIGVITAL